MASDMTAQWKIAAMRYEMKRVVLRALTLMLMGLIFSVASGGCATGGQEGSEPSNVLACRLSNYGEYQDAAWEHLPSIGIKYVFINIPEPQRVEDTMERLAEHGLTVVVMRGHADLSKPACVDELGVQLAICEKMGVKYMFLSAKRQGADKQVVYERLRRAGEVAKKHGVTIALETHPDLGTNGDVHLETMRQVNHPNVRVNFDTGNIHYYNRNKDACMELKKIIEYVATVELKDHNGQFETWNFPPLGKGIVDLAGVVKILKEHGFCGPMTMEIEGVRGVERNEDQIKKEIADSAEYIRSLGGFN